MRPATLAFLAIGVLGAAVPGAFAQAPASGPAPAAAAAPALPEEQLREAYRSVQAIGGTQYTFLISGTPDEAFARKAFAQLERAGAAAIERAGFKKMTYTAYQMPPAMLRAVRNTPILHLGAPFQLGDKWALVFPLERKGGPVPSYENFHDRLADYIRAGALPDPAVPMTEPRASSYAAARVMSVAALAGLPPAFDVDVVLPDGKTMLIDAVAREQRDLVSALLDRHADPNHCSSGVCPLEMAALAGDPVGAVRLLLDRGATADRKDPAAGVLSTVLVEAMSLPKAPELAEFLLSRGANPDGGDSETTPVIMAAARGNREAIEVLLRHGADLFRESSSAQSYRNALTAATAAKTDPAFRTWLDGRWAEVARKSGRYDWQGWIEQDGKRYPIGDGPIVLQRKPFDIGVSMRVGATLAVASAADRSIFDEFDRADPANSLFFLGTIGADACNGVERQLFVNAGGDHGKDKTPWITQAWTASADAGERCTSFRSVEGQGGSAVHVRTIASLLQPDSKVEQPIAVSTPTALYVVMGTQVPAAFPGFTYFGPQRVEIRFR
jgi:hypothetical protein